MNSVIGNNFLATEKKLLKYHITLITLIFILYISSNKGFTYGYISVAMKLISY